MKLTFTDRKSEKLRLERSLKSKDNVLIVIYGRRRCGKSTLLQKVKTFEDIYYLADQRETSLHLEAISEEISKVIKGFNSVKHPSWSSLFEDLNNRATKRITLFMDEFPYMVMSSQELPSVIQKYIDMPGEKNINLVLCGSSQRMMQGMVMNAAAPLYGRASEIIKIEPLKAGWINEALCVNGSKALEYYSIFGGVPRYWELAKEFNSLEDAIKSLCFDRNGILHNEPMRLLIDEMKSAIQPFSILSLIGSGCSKISEIASRLEKPVTSMTRPISILTELGYLKKEVIFGERDKNSKKTYYRISDPFVDFYFKFIQPNKSMLELDLIEQVWDITKVKRSLYFSQVWEELARQSVPFLNINNIQWLPASRWWGKGIDGKDMEIDILSESLDKKYVLAGEAKWMENMNTSEILSKLKYSTSNIPCLKKRKIIYALWLKEKTPINSDNVVTIIYPNDVFAKLK